MLETYIPVENLRIKIPKYIEETLVNEDEKDNNLLSFLYKFIICLFKIRIPRFFTVYKIF